MHTSADSHELFLQYMSESPNPNADSAIEWGIIGDLSEEVNAQKFTLQPSALKISGYYSLSSNPMLFAIDNNYYANNHNVASHYKSISVARSQGMFWFIRDFSVNKIEYRHPGK